MPAPSLRVIVPARIFADPARMTRVVENQMDMTAEGIRTDFEVTVATWARKPQFIIYRHRGVRIIATSDVIYKFLNSGTRVRRAMMSRGFRSKTVPRSIKSRVGRGGRVYVSSRLNLPGIEPREFSETIAKKWRKQFPILLQRAFDTELNRP